MKIVLKILAMPVMLLLTMAVAFCTFILMMTGIVAWIVSGLVFAGALILFFSHQPAGGIAFLVIAFLVSPYGLLALAVWVVGKLDGAKYSLREFIIG
ncbi:CD1845 family protein [Ruminococcaceae bacterium OttesenSCG-928-I18]|nr:CD1845 family protein [Ruminococcaceae bacterium OttesenSCG-928-I18]